MATATNQQLRARIGHPDDLVAGLRYTVFSGVDGGEVWVTWGGRNIPAVGVAARVAAKAMREFRPPAHAQDRSAFAVIATD